MVNIVPIYLLVNIIPIFMTLYSGRNAKKYYTRDKPGAASAEPKKPTVSAKGNAEKSKDKADKKAKKEKKNKKGK
mgnify:CR=1 FL=1